MNRASADECMCHFFVSAPLFFDAFKPNCGYNRGCSFNAFCDFDYGLTGFCESCEDYSSVWDCNNNDFTQAGDFTLYRSMLEKFLEDWNRVGSIRFRCWIILNSQTNI